MESGRSLAPKAAVATRNSCTISRPTATRLPPVVSSRLSMPSMRMALLRGRMPPAVKPLSPSAVRVPVMVRWELEPAEGATAGAARTKLR